MTRASDIVIDDSHIYKSTNLYISYIYIYISYIYISYVYIYIYIYIIRFLEEATEKWSEWDSNPHPLNLF